MFSPLQINWSVCKMFVPCWITGCCWDKRICDDSSEQNTNLAMLLPGGCWHFLWVPFERRCSPKEKKKDAFVGPLLDRWERIDQAERRAYWRVLSINVNGVELDLCNNLLIQFLLNYICTNLSFGISGFCCCLHRYCHMKGNRLMLFWAVYVFMKDLF